MSENVKMKAVDTLHISALGPNNIAPGGEFEVSGAMADDLEKRNLATRVGGAKKDSAPANKMEAPPANKSSNPESAPEPGKPRAPISGGAESAQGFVDTAKRGRSSKK